MNNKSKGTTLIEILISILLMSFIMVFLFNILISMKEEYNLSFSRSQESINRATYTRLIQNDLINIGLKKINVLNDGNEDRFCIEFELSDNTKKKLIVENVVDNDKKVGRIIYDDEGWTMEDGTYVISNITFTYIEPKYEKYHESGDNKYINDPDADYYVLKIIIPSSHDIDSEKKLDVEISHIENTSVVSTNFCQELRNYFQNNLRYSDIINSTNINCINS